MAGLACALHLSRAGVPVCVFEAAEVVGGRVRTDRSDGFQLDRGFQVLTTSYPEARRVLEFETLGLGRFLPGALVRMGGGFERFVDPLRAPRELLATLRSRTASLPDKLRVLALRRRVGAGPLEALYERPEKSTLEYLHERGFGSGAIEHFLRPFFAGVFLEQDLATSSRFFEFAFRMFATGHAALPAEGMEALPRQLAAQLPHGTVRTGIPVASIEEGGLRVEGDRIEAAAVVVATDATAAAALVPGLTVPEFLGTTCLYFESERSPLGAPILVLDGEGRGPINHLCVPSDIAPSYAPCGRALISANVVGIPSASDRELEAAVRSQLESWFGASVSAWRLLRIHRIQKALPRQLPGWLDPVSRPARMGSRLFVCGDYREIASLQGALVSGRRAAEAVLASLG
jgi:phytoene dehydrogenase-like protein